MAGDAAFIWTWLLLQKRTLSTGLAAAALLLLLLADPSSYVAAADDESTAVAAAFSRDAAMMAGGGKTVMAWIEGNFTDVADFVLYGPAKGAVNAVSHTSVFRLHANSTAAEFVVDSAALAKHKRMWQQGTAKQLGI